MSFIVSNFATILISAVLIACIIAVLRVMHKNAKGIKRCCGCQCNGCEHAEKCDKN